jgi:hypothetical protein
VNAEEWPPPQAEPAVIVPRIIKNADKRLMKVELAHAFSVRSIKQENIDLLLNWVDKDSAQESWRSGLAGDL